MSHRAVKAFQALVRHVLAAAKIKKSKVLSKYHTMMPQKGRGEIKALHLMQNMDYDVTTTSFAMIKFGKSVFMITELPLCCILLEM